MTHSLSFLALSDPRPLIAGGAVFGLVLSLFSGGMLLWWRRRGKRIEALRERLDLSGTERAGARTLSLWLDGDKVSTVVPGLPDAPTFAERLAQLRLDADLSLPLGALLALVATLALAVALLLGISTGRVMPAVVGFAGVLLVTWVVVGMRIAKRARLFEQQLIDGLELCARALRAGHPLLAAFQLIGEEIAAPVGTLFSGICQQQSMGVRMDEALRRSATLSRSADMQLFAASLAIHMRTGGNLADVMQGIALVIRQRMRLQRRFRVLVAQTQISKRILLAMPFGIFVVLNLVGPEYMQPLYNTSAGQFLLLIAGASLLAGWAVMNRMANLRA
ncbi:MAG TPA: type II secretion system F family protein [Planctomycetota bacterium]|nr:type II secretion system F family protein [Planctomycetota bacterium]